MSLEQETLSGWQKVKRRAKQAVTSLMLPFMLSVSPGAQTQRFEQTGNINDISRSRQRQTIQEVVSYVEDFLAGNITPSDTGWPMTRLKYEGKDGSDPKNTEPDDLFGYISAHSLTGGFDSFEGNKWAWSVSTMDPDDPKDVYFYQQYELERAVMEVTLTASGIYLQNPNQEFTNIVRRAIAQVNPENMMSDLYDWENHDFEPSFGKDAGERMSSTLEGPGRPGDEDAFLIYHPEEAFKYFKEFGLRTEEQYGRISEYSMQDVRVEALRKMFWKVMKTPEAFTLVRKTAAETGIDTALLNVMAAAPFFDTYVNKGVAQTTTITHEQPFKNEEEEQSEEDKLLKDLIRSSFEAQKREGRSVIDMPSDTLWHPSVVSIYKHVRDEEDDYHQGHIQKQASAITHTFQDPEFYTALPEEFNVMGLGCSDDPNERDFIERSIAIGKEVRQFVFVDMDKTAYANAISSMQESVKQATGKDIEGIGFPLKIGQESLRQVLDDEEVRTDAPLVYMAEGLVNFDGTINDEHHLYGDIVASLRPNDRMIVAKPLENNHENEATYHSSILAGAPLLELADLDMTKWAFDRVHYDQEQKQYTIEYRCYETDKEFDAGDTLRFLHSSRNSILDILSDEIMSGEITATYRNPDAEQVGYEVVVLERTSMQEVSE